MPVTLKCAACGAEVEFEDLAPDREATCPGCSVQVRYRAGDEQMAIPVSMNLPEEFAHVDLSTVADKSSLLVGRYKKPVEQDEGVSTDAILAKALESLANSIGHLEERLNRHEQGNAPGGNRGVNEDPSVGNGQAAGGPVPPASREGNVAAPEGPGDTESGEEVVHLAASEKLPTKGGSKASPVGARVLVRREAARVAHEFRREKHIQSDWDQRGQRNKRGSSGGFAGLMDRFPKTTIAISLMLAVALVLATIMWMDDFFGDEKGNAHGEASSGQGTKLSELMENDPEAAMAETVARAYLNATTARTAAPFVFESDAIAEKFNNYYRPITGPGSYELNFKQRAIGEDGRAQFLYRVVIQGEKERMLVVLPEGAMPKVFWEHFAEVGDLSWDAFFDVKPKEPVEMRVWAYPDDTYVDGYSQSVWQNYVLHDYAEKKKIMGYARRGTGEDWRIADALKNEPVDFVRHTAVMALVRLTYMTEYKTAADSGAVAEIKEVIATSWLPEEFRAKRAEK